MEFFKISGENNIKIHSANLIYEEKIFIVIINSNGWN